jgi:hypothetical protein
MEVPHSDGSRRSALYEHSVAKNMKGLISLGLRHATVLLGREIHWFDAIVPFCIECILDWEVSFIGHIVA